MMILTSTCVSPWPQTLWYTLSHKYGTRAVVIVSRGGMDGWVYETCLFDIDNWNVNQYPAFDTNLSPKEYEKCRKVEDSVSDW